MSKLLKKATSNIETVPFGRFEIFNLIDNPFPSQAILNKDSTEKKLNGSIYEPEIRTAEFEKLLNNFLRSPQSDINHQRLGFLLDSSYIGRGNGKTAFLLNVLRKINNDYCLDLSGGVNKCFAVYFQPEAGGKTKTFDSFVDLFFQAVIDTDIIKNSLAILRLESIISLKQSEEILELYPENELVEKLNSDEWFGSEGKEKLDISRREITINILSNQHLQNLSKDFPLYRDTKFLTPLVTQRDFEDHYNNLKKGKAKFDFVFTELVSLFLASGFNGAYVFVDDFERIPDHQSAIQKKDFVTQLRTILYDGLYSNSKIGFYNFFFALHAGVPRILQEAWALSGLEHRVSLNPAFDNPRHMILFDKINEMHAILLVGKYLSEYRINPIEEGNKLTPFTEEAVKIIGIKSELNAAKILQMACNIIEHAADNKVDKIDAAYVQQLTKQGNVNIEHDQSVDSISKTETIDLMGKAQKKD
ncbi:MAG: hypothetical protein EOO43_04680 [Flavobacterium sp.]|nr:MAG: hypothetical protein EOO43_04680 [Flavobacterium sp.]